MEPSEKIQAILEHIANVQRNCFKLGLKLIASGKAEEDLAVIERGRMLISNGQIHDNSKLSGIEWEHLFGGDDLLGVVVKHHQATNPHHPEYWGGIKNMPEVYLAEMACDVLARSQEFGSDVRKWIKVEATKKYGFTMNDKIGKTLTKYLNMLLSPPFKKKT